MAAEGSTIHPLPADVVAQIKSSVLITSLNDVILGLLGNALDAGALRVDISVDFARGGCTVEDDGAGVPPSEFREDGGLGRLYYTSKFHSRARTHGRNGMFLASLMALSLVTITSHHHLHRSHNTLSVHQTKVISRLMPAPAHQYLLCRNHGTRVTVRDLFGNMPVRIKQRTLSSGEGKDTEAEWEDLKRVIVSVLLAEAREVHVIVRDTTKDRKFTIRPPGSATGSMSLNARDFEAMRSKRASCDLSLIRSILAQTSYITPASWDSWVAVSACIPHLSIEGAISLDPAPTKQVQYISFGVRPLSPAGGNNIFFDEINRLFAASGFGVVDDESDIDELEKERRLKDRRYKSDGYTNKQLKGGRKGVDRWPMFSLCFKMKDHETSQNTLYKDDALNGDGYLASLLELLGVVVTEFLAQNHFGPRSRQAKVLAESPEAISGSSVDTGSRRLRSESRPKGTPGHSSQMLLHASGDALSKTRFLITQRPPDPNLSKQESKKRRLSASRHDALGKDVKIPSFSRSLCKISGPSLDLYSRVRSGKKGFIEDSCGIIPRTPASLETGNTASGTGSETAQPSDEDETSSKTEDIAQCPGVPGPYESDELNTADGKREGSLSGADRADELLEGQQPLPGPNNTDASPPILGSDSLADDFIRWVNPITNTSLFVNSRTGVASHVSKKPKRKPHRSSPASHQTTPSNNVFQPFKRLKPTSRTESLVEACPKTWIGDLLKDWENPIFKFTEQEIPQVRLLEGTSSEASNILHGRYRGCSRVEVENALKESNSAVPGKLSREVLKTAQVIAQVDKKFILVKATALCKSGGTRDLNSSGELLVLIDQHAADERCRIEDLLEGLCTLLGPDKPTFRSSLGLASRIATTHLLKSTKFRVSPREHRLFKIHAHHFASWGILYDLVSPPAVASMIESNGEYSVVVRTLPPGIAERCMTDAKLVVELLRMEVWKRDESFGTKRMPIAIKHDLSISHKIDTDVALAEEDGCNWLRMIGDCPQGILDLLNSRSCRSAIMFNDELTIAECRALVSQLARCKFPFQCAHGRPSMIPLVDLSPPATVTRLKDAEGKSAEFTEFGAGSTYQDISCKDFVSAFKRWRGNIVLTKASTTTD